jgi:antirestriction protein ArdC
MEARVGYVTSDIKEAEEIATKYQEQIQVQYGGSRAHYRPSTDSIQMPLKETFDNAEAYYSTLFHEFTHSTGHASRLNWAGIVENHFFGDEIYSKEELIAEMGGAMLCGITGMESRSIKIARAISSRGLENSGKTSA